MLKKLYKHEFKFMARALFPVGVFVLITAIFALVFTFFFEDNKDLLPTVLFTVFTFTFYSSLAVCFFVIFGICIVRFTNNLFTDQGYFSFCLPVSNMSHFYCKFIVAITSIVAYAIFAYLNLAMVLSTMDYNLFAITAQHIMWNINNDLWGFLAFILMIVVFIIAEGLIICACVCIGQRFKNKSAPYFLFIAAYIFQQIVFFILLSNESYSAYQEIETKTYTAGVSVEVASQSSMLPIQFALTFSFVLAIYGIISYIICRHTFTKKINLN